MPRTIVFYENYFLNFYEAQNEQTKDKIKFCLRILESKKVVPTKYVRHITNGEGLYEIRVSVGNNQYPILFFSKREICFKEVIL